MTIPVSVVIITKDEELAIERCVRSVADFDQVFVLDSNSKDLTQALAAAAGAEVVPFTWNGRYPKKKQWALENLPLRNEWVLYLDGDEYSTPALNAEIARVVARPSAAAYDVALDYVFLGRRLRHGHKVYKRILFDRTRCRWDELDDLAVENPFEMELHVQPTVRGAVGRLAERLPHEDLEPLTHYFDRHNRYSDWEAVLRQDACNTPRVQRTKQGMLFARAPFKPLAFFLYAYLVRQGWRDGRAGFHYALANSFYYWQIGLKTRAYQESAQRQAQPHSVVSDDGGRGGERMRVLLVAANVSPRYGGPAIAATAYGRALGLTGADVRLVTTTLDGRHRLAVPTGRVVDHDGVPTVFCRPGRGTSKPMSVQWAREIWRGVRWADVVHVQSLYLFHNVVVYAACRWTRTPYCVRPHGTLEPYQRVHRAVRKRLWDSVIGRRYLDHAAAVHFTAQSELDRASDLLRPGQGRVVPVPVDVPPSPAALATRQVLYLGRVARKKRADLLLAAWPAVRAAHPDAELAIAGPMEPDMEAVRQAAAPGVCFHGVVRGDAKRELLETSRVFALPSENENFGVAVAEAMAAGLPVVVTEGVALAGDVARSRAGCVVPAGDRDALAAALIRFLSDDDAARTAGSAGRGLVGERLAPAAVGAALASVLRELVSA